MHGREAGVMSRLSAKVALHPVRRATILFSTTSAVGLGPMPLGLLSTIERGATTSAGSTPRTADVTRLIDALSTPALSPRVNRGLIVPCPTAAWGV